MPQLAFLRVPASPKSYGGYAIHDGPAASWSGGPFHMRVAWGDGWADRVFNVWLAFWIYFEIPNLYKKRCRRPGIDLLHLVIFYSQGKIKPPSIPCTRILGGYRHNFRHETPEGAGRDYLGSEAK